MSTKSEGTAGIPESLLATGWATEEARDYAMHWGRRVDDLIIRAASETATEYGHSPAGLTLDKLQRAREMMSRREAQGSGYRMVKVPESYFSRAAMPDRWATEYRLRIDDYVTALIVSEDVIRGIQQDSRKRFSRIEEMMMDNYVNQEMVLHLARAMASSKEKEAMTRSDYKIIAVGIAKSALPSLEKRIVAEDLGKELIKENPRFNVEKFIEACLTTYDTTDHPAGPAQAPL